MRGLRTAQSDAHVSTIFYFTCYPLSRLRFALEFSDFEMYVRFMVVLFHFVSAPTLLERTPREFACPCRCNINISGKKFLV